MTLGDATVGLNRRQIGQERAVLGVALIAFAVGFVAPGTGFNWIGWVGVIPLVTALAGSCPLYSVLGLSSRA